ncbi:hypothetical protein MLD38_036551 [Melastoma candidum]|uniref:Uncharacterized protein n=1 Tax=Melastoma candidum TaxID=119954 RepID=A0ACB9LLW9_9MYRT|nr:hypothetical protein MLD38_036551 [Melastoma candidum]
MQGNRGGSHPSFESDFPFPEFGRPFPGFEGFGGLGRQRSLVSTFFEGRDPFDNPFFTNPFGGMFESNFFGARGSPLMDMLPPPTMIVNHSRAPERTGPIIEELNSDEEKEESGDNRKENPRKHGRSSWGPDPEDADNEVRRSKYVHHGSDFGSGPSDTKLQTQGPSFTFHSSSVSYGGANGTYYTSSMTRQSGINGVVFEECKEADSSTMQATHRISRGIHNKGHSVTRKLGSDGKVDTIQTLHNLNEDQLPQFEKNWNGNAGRHLPRWSEDVNRHGSYINQGGYALPSTQHQAVRPNARERAQLLQGQHSGSIVIDAGAKNGRARQRGRGQVQP